MNPILLNKLKLIKIFKKTIKDRNIERCFGIISCKKEI